jgi:hypothetical protein
MYAVVSVSSQIGGTGNESGAFASLNAGFLGTGYSSSVELSFIAIALIFGYVAISTVRYFLPETRFFDIITASLGFRD